MDAPDKTLVTPLVLVMLTLAERVLVKVQLVSTLAGGVKTAVRVVPVKVTVGAGDTGVPVESFKQLIAVMYLVMLLVEPDVSVTVTEPDRLC